MPAQMSTRNMNGALPARSSTRPQAASRSTPLHVRIRHRLQRRYRLWKISLKTAFSFSEVVQFALGVVLFVSVWRSIAQHWAPHEPFDDVADMEMYEQRRRDALAMWLNKTSESELHPSDGARSFNMTEVKEARAQWDFVYRELTRRANPPKLTKYKVRLLRELYARTHYVATPKLNAHLHTTCNYLNNIADDGDLSSFSCAPTSHKCDDGGFSPSAGFAPVEGYGVSWDDVVIVVMLGAGRADFLQGLTDTWVARLDPAATLVLSRDNGAPELPPALANRPNTVVYDYRGPAGLDNLDVKALTTWKYIHNRYQVTNKKYFLKIDDDTYLVTHNLLRFLNKVDKWFAPHEEPLYFGHPFCGHGDLEALGYARWCYAGGGAYGLNTEALGMMVRQILGGCAYFYDYVAKAPDLKPVDDAYGGRYEDVMVGRCLRQAKTRAQVNGTSLLACGSFFPYAPLHYFEQFGHDVGAMTHKLGDTYITLHNLMPSAMRYLDDFLFEYPVGGIVPFTLENPRLQDEMLRICRMEGKKMHCDYESDKMT